MTRLSSKRLGVQRKAAQRTRKLFTETFCAFALLTFLGIEKMGEVGRVVRREDLNAEIAEEMHAEYAESFD